MSLYFFLSIYLSIYLSKCNHPPHQIPIRSFFQNLGDMLVFSVEYRKAPRFTFPSQIEETEAVMHYILSRATFFGFDTSRVAIMGDSAGGALAATIAIKMRPTDPEVLHPLALQVG